MKLNFYILLPVMFFFLWTSHQSSAQHDDICNCAGEYVPGERTTKINTINPFTNEQETLIVEERDGYYIWQGDIILGKIGETASRNVFSHQIFWPNNIMPFDVDPGFSQTMLDQIGDAIATINSSTNINILPRTNQVNYVKISPGSNCSSMIGPQPNIGHTQMHLKSTCSYGTIMHELLHAAGINHEQMRLDRDNYVSVNFNNIPSNKWHNFGMLLHNSWSVHGEYDYGSIMHYGAYAFAIDPNIKTITTLGGQAIGQRTALSVSDIETVNAMYPRCFNTNISLNNNEIQPGRYKSSGTVTINGNIPNNTNVIVSGGSEIKLTPGSSIGYPGNTSFREVKLVLQGCNIN